MRFVLLLASLALVAATTGAAAPARVLTVPGTADLFAAGLTTPPNLPGGGGTLPPRIQFAAGAGKVVTFPGVSGELRWGLSSPILGPNGDPAMPTNILALGGISGLVAPGWLFLAGVFLGDGAPTTPPPLRLRMENVAHVATISPKLQQPFYVGDGLTAGGVLRTYVVPANATRLYLGFLDAPGKGRTPADYADNKGSVTVTVRLARASG
jgi:hypothetical protein